VTWWIVVNPGAGHGRDIAARARAALDVYGIEATLHVSESAEHVSHLIGEGVAAGATRFGGVGGDGTVNLVVDALMRLEWPEPPCLGILPAGSGCDFIRTFGIPQEMERAAGHFAGDDTYRVDVAHLEGPWGDRYFLNVAESGLGAAVIALADRLPARLGAVRYKLAIWPTLLPFPRAEILLEAAGRTYQGPAVLVVFANAQYFGGGMNVAPRASLVDGRLDIQIFEGPKRVAVVLQPRLTRGTHLSHKAVRRFEAPTFTLQTDPEWPVEADGEHLGSGPLTGRVLPGAIDVKV